MGMRENDHARFSRANLPSRCSGLEVELRGVSLRLGVSFGEGSDSVGSNVGGVSLLQSSLVTSLDGLEDGVGLCNGLLLLALVLGSGVDTRVEENERVLGLGNLIEITSLDSTLQVIDASTINNASLGDSGGRDSTIGKGELRESSDGSGTKGNLAKGGTAVHVQGSARALLQL